MLAPGFSSDDWPNHLLTVIEVEEAGVVSVNEISGRLRANCLDGQAVQIEDVAFHVVASCDVLQPTCDSGFHAEALVNTVNCVGVMGRGIALRFKRAFPENFKAYAARCKRNEIQPGKVFIFETGEMISPRFIVNFPTKRHWRGKSRIEDIESGLGSLAEEIRSRGIRSIAIPALGSGLGGLNWSEVRSRMQEALSELDDVRVVIFEPGGGPADRRGNAGSIRSQIRRN